jgi:hypothetical protein
MEQPREAGKHPLLKAVVEEGHPGRSLERVERDVEEGHPRANRCVSEGRERPSEPMERDVAEGNVREAGPEAAPPAGEQAGTCGGGGEGEAAKDLEKQIIWEGADEVGFSDVPWDLYVGHDGVMRSVV